MQRTREFTTERLYGMGFIVIVLGMVWSQWSVFMFLVMIPVMLAEEGLGARVLCLLFNLSFFNLNLSFYMAMMTDPGLVPRSWGFYMGDETKRRRYCKMCNVWKPDRTHHCSLCNRCILNMDHHCPWINNCVGFYNRKFFIQLLFYVYLSLLIIGVATLGTFGESCMLMYKHWGGFLMWYDDAFLAEDLVEKLGAFGVHLLVSSYVMTWLLLATLTNFFKFHLRLIWENYTTIENIEREPDQRSKFDIGPRRNLEQVLGANTLLWLLPLHLPMSRPVGDGVRWRVHYTRVIDEDEELPADDEQPNYQHRMFPQSRR